MTPTAGWTILLAVLLGHFGLMLASYNRINGFGWPRKVIKSIVKVMFAYTLVLPPLVYWLAGDVVRDLVAGRPNQIAVPLPLMIYAVACGLAWPLLGIPWLWWRPIFRREWVDAPRVIEVVPVQSVVSVPLALSWKCRFEQRLPMNQIFELAIEQIELPVEGLPAGLDGYTIAHLSDIHLTGDVHPDFSAYAVERASRWKPEMMVITGDIIDKRACIDWLPKIFSQATAADGCYYVLGNHDTRIVDPRLTRTAMDHAGWTDLGSRSLVTRLRGIQSMLIGNEYPWFGRPPAEAMIDDEADFRLLLSHSPDQFGWARRHGIDLMLAGHTHGGQGRLPLAGPLLSPSFYGSRYASGDFFRQPTTMHVSRGLAGTHLIRFRCRPELSLLTLRSPSRRSEVEPRPGR